MFDSVGQSFVAQDLSNFKGILRSLSLLHRIGMRTRHSRAQLGSVFYKCLDLFDKIGSHPLILDPKLESLTLLPKRHFCPFSAFGSALRHVCLKTLLPTLTIKTFLPSLDIKTSAHYSYRDIIFGRLVLVVFRANPNPFGFSLGPCASLATSREGPASNFDHSPVFRCSRRRWPRWWPPA